MATRQQRAVQRERWVLGGGPDECDGAGLDHRQEAVLLGAIEAVDFIDEQQSPLPRAPAASCFLECTLEIGDAGEHRGELDEVQSGAGGEQAGDGGLAATGWPPKDQ